MKRTKGSQVLTAKREADITRKEQVKGAKRKEAIYIED